MRLASTARTQRTAGRRRAVLFNVASPRPSLPRGQPLLRRVVGVKYSHAAGDLAHYQSVFTIHYTCKYYPLDSPRRAMLAMLCAVLRPATPRYAGGRSPRRARAHPTVKQRGVAGRSGGQISGSRFPNYSSCRANRSRAERGWVVAWRGGTTQC